MRALIIDERNNGGGEVDNAMKCANAFLSQGKTIVTLEGRKGTNSSQKYTASGATQVPADLPVVLLVNGGSASSSEIFAAALHGRDAIHIDEQALMDDDQPFLPFAG